MNLTSKNTFPLKLVQHYMTGLQTWHNNDWALGHTSYKLNFEINIIQNVLAPINKESTTPRKQNNKCTTISKLILYGIYYKDFRHKKLIETLFLKKNLYN